MSIAFGFHPLAIVLALIGAAILTWWTYRRTTPPISNSKRGALIALRWLSLSLVLLLLAEPVARTIARESQSPIIAVLVDASRSLSADVHPGQDYSAAIEQALEAVSAATGRAAVETFTFGSEVVPRRQQADTLAFDEARTDIASALDHIGSQYAGRPLRAVVLLSDGRYNTGKNPLYAGERFPVPIHTVVVGDTATYRDLRIERVATNEVGYVGRTMPVEVTLHAKGFDGQRPRVTVNGPGIAAADTTVTIRGDEAVMRLNFSVIPPREGFQRLEATVDFLEGERTDANNSVSFSARILRRKVAILLVAGGPSPDVAALREMLQDDPDLQVDAYTQKSATDWYEGNPPPQSLDTYDAVILAGYPGRQADTRILDAIAEADKPVLFLLDRSTDLRLVREKLGAVLPVSVETVRRGFVDASAVESAVGRTHPILEVSGDLERLPPLAYSSSRWTPAPDARTLATISIRGITLDDPLLVVRSRSGTRSAAILGAGIWRWRNVPEDLSDLDEVFPELVNNVLQWVTTKSDDRPVRVHPTEALFDGGDIVQFVGGVYDESLQPMTNASLVLSITDSEGSTFDYRMESLGNGRYSGIVGRLPEGSYRYVARAEQGGVSVGADSGHFAVDQLLVEFQDTQADPDLLRGLAGRSGGVFTYLDQTAALIDKLSNTELLQSESLETETQLPLRRYWPFLFIVVGLLSAEWIIRKRSGMV